MITTSKRSPATSSNPPVCRSAWPANRRARSWALSGLRLAMASTAGACRAMGRMAPRVAPPAPQISTRRPCSDRPRLRWMSLTRPTPSKFSAWMRSPSNFSALAAPASRAPSAGSVASSKAWSLNGMVTLAPSPPDARNRFNASANPSTGASIAVYSSACAVACANSPWINGDLL